jgi:2'-5' RNA ligase
MPTHTEQVRNHWWWRPGWRAGRSFYTWHLTFVGQPDVDRLAAHYHAVLRDLPGVDPVPVEWLHLTMQGLGFTDELATGQVDKVVAAVRDRLAALSPFELTLGPVRVDPEALLLDAEPAGAIRDLRLAIRAGIADTWGADRVPEAEAPFTPHVSIGYISADGPAAPFVAVLDASPATGRATVTEAQLIVLNRDSGMYTWRPYATAELGSLR